MIDTFDNDQGLILLDLDGTTRATKSGKQFINDPFDQEILPNVFSVLERIKTAKTGYRTTIANQF